MLVFKNDKKSTPALSTPPRPPLSIHPSPPPLPYPPFPNPPPPNHPSPINPSSTTPPHPPLPYPPLPYHPHPPPSSFTSSMLVLQVFLPRLRTSCQQSMLQFTSLKSLSLLFLPRHSFLDPTAPLQNHLPTPPQPNTLPPPPHTHPTSLLPH